MILGLLLLGEGKGVLDGVVFRSVLSKLGAGVLKFSRVYSFLFFLFATVKIFSKVLYSKVGRGLTSD
jgi:hypothetical protein